MSKKTLYYIIGVLCLFAWLSDLYFLFGKTWYHQLAPSIKISLMICSVIGLFLGALASAVVSLLLQSRRVILLSGLLAAIFSVPMISLASGSWLAGLGFGLSFYLAWILAYLLAQLLFWLFTLSDEEETKSH